MKKNIFFALLVLFPAFLPAMENDTPEKNEDALVVVGKLQPKKKSRKHRKTISEGTTSQTSSEKSDKNEATSVPTPPALPEKKIVKKDSPRNDLNASIYQPVTPKESSLSYSEKCLLLYKGTERFISEYLESKIFDPSNLEHMRLLNEALITHSTNKKKDELSKLLTACRKEYSKDIKLSKKSAALTHTFLVNYNKEHLNRFKKTIETRERNFIQKQNETLITLSQVLEQHMHSIAKDFADHQKERELLLEANGQIARTTKKDLRNVHKLRRDAFDTGYCSDDERVSSEYYSNNHLVSKIGSSATIELTDAKLGNALKLLAQLNEKLASIRLQSPESAQSIVNKDFIAKRVQQLALADK